MRKEELEQKIARHGKDIPVMVNIGGYLYEVEDIRFGFINWLGGDNEDGEYLQIFTTADPVVVKARKKKARREEVKELLRRYRRIFSTLEAASDAVENLEALIQITGMDLEIDEAQEKYRERITELEHEAQDIEQKLMEMANVEC